MSLFKNKTKLASLLAALIFVAGAGLLLPAMFDASATTGASAATGNAADGSGGTVADGSSDEGSGGTVADGSSDEGTGADVQGVGNGRSGSGVGTTPGEGNTGDGRPSSDDHDNLSNVNSGSAGVTNNNNNNNNSSGAGINSPASSSESVPESAPQAQPSCTISIRCDTILSNLGVLNPDKSGIVPASGVIMAARTVSFSDGESVFDVLQREVRASSIHMETSFSPLYGSAYIDGIANLYEFDCGALSGWMYRVNGWFPNYGCSSYRLSDGDVVEWIYTCDLGNDIGGGAIAQR